MDIIDLQRERNRYPLLYLCTDQWSNNLCFINLFSEAFQNTFCGRFLYESAE